MIDRGTKIGTPVLFVVGEGEWLWGELANADDEHVVIVAMEGDDPVVIAPQSSVFLDWCAEAERALRPYG